MTRYPRLLDGSMQETARLLPSRLSVTLNITPLSTAEMVLPEGNPAVSVRQWVQLYGPDGSLGIFRVASVNTTYGSQQQVSLEHGIVSLEDATIPAETEELTGSMRSILQSILACQNSALWKLGAVDVPDSESYTLTTNADILLQAMINAAALVSGYAFEFDQTTSPWTVSLRKLSDAVACECRMNRNISGINIKLDESGLVTRVTSLYLPEGYQDGPTVGTWGVISRPLDYDGSSEDDEATSSAKAQKAATAYLDAHKSPAVSIEIDAIRLAEQTGEPLDAFHLGTVCRAALTDWGVIAKERIITLYYMDILSDPDEVRLTLSSPERDASNGLAGVRRSTTQLQSTTNNNARRITSAFKHITETENAVRIQADQIELQGKEISLKAEKAVVDDAVLRLNTVEIDLDAANAELRLKASQSDVDSIENRVSSAEIVLNGDDATIGLVAQVSKNGERISSAEIAIDGANAAIALKAEKATVDGLSSRLSQAEIDIDGANAAIALKANQTTVDELGTRVSSAEIAIDGANAEIALKVSKDGLISAINMSPESIKISSSKIELDGQTIVSKLEGLYLDVSSIDAVEADFNSIWAVNGTFDNLTIGSYGISLASKYVCTGGKGVSAVGTTVINYLDHDGNKKSEKVVIGVDQYQLPTTNLYYLSYDGG